MKGTPKTVSVPISVIDEVVQVVQAAEVAVAEEEVVVVPVEDFLHVATVVTITVVQLKHGTIPILGITTRLLTQIIRVRLAMSY